ncbi:magnesium-translocating P-type ATPase, partial [Klebsiella variicola]
MATFEKLSREGFRLLGIAWRRAANDQAKAVAADEADLTFAGFAVFVDPPKASAPAAIDGLRRLGVATKVVTGDNEFVARHVCSEIGMAVDAILTGG